MRKFKTSKENRTNYIYLSETGERIVLTPEDVDSSWIEILHDFDDKAIDADRREDYHTPVHYEGYLDGESNDANSCNAYLADNTYNPLQSLFDSMEQQAYEEKIIKLHQAIKTLQPQQIALIHKVFYERRTNVDIAAEEGVTEAAIRNRLKKIYENLRKKL